jgi:integrase
MGRKRTDSFIDPATGKPLPDAVAYRGPGQYRARKLVNGRRVTKTFATARIAARWLAGVEVDRERGLFIDRSEAERVTLGKTIERYQEEVLGDDSEKRGAEKERGHLKIVLADPMCDIRMASLASADLAKFRDRMKAADYAPATIVRRLNLIQTIIEHARREWRIHLTENPARMVKRPAGADRKRDRVFAPLPERNAARAPTAELPAKSEEERLLAACDNDTNRWLGPIVRFAIHTALRQGEIVGLRWADIDLTKRIAVVRGAAGTVTKNGEVREVPLLPAAIEILKKLTRSAAGRVFPIDQNVLKMRYRRAVARAGILGLTFHDLRHIGTSRLAKLYPNPLDLKRVTGHKDLKSLDRYYHTTAEELAARVTGEAVS